MPLPSILGELGSLAMRGAGLPRANSRTPPFFGGSPGKLASPTPGPAAAQTAAPDEEPDESNTAPSGSAIAPAPTQPAAQNASTQVKGTLNDPEAFMTPAERAVSQKMQEPIQNAHGVRKVFGTILAGLGSTPQWTFLQPAAQNLLHPGLSKRNAQISSDLDLATLQRSAANEGLKAQEAQARIANTQANTQALNDYRTGLERDRQQQNYDREMDRITSPQVGGFEAPVIPPSLSTIPVGQDNSESTPAGSGLAPAPTALDTAAGAPVSNLPQRNLIFSPGLSAQQSSSLGTVQNLKNPSTGEVTPMVRPNLQTQAEMKRVEAPQDIVDFYKNLPPDFTKQYPVTPPQIGPDGKVSPEEAKRLEQKYQRDSAALQAFNQQKGKPASTAENKEAFQQTLAKVAGAGQLPDGAMSNVNLLSKSIRSAQSRGVLTPQEANGALAYLAANNTPAATGTNTTIRAEGMGNIRLSPVLDTKNGNTPTLMSANDLNEANRQEPGRFIPASSGTNALNKTALLEDIRGSIQQTRDSLKTIPEFSPSDKAKIAVAMRDRDPRSAISQLIGSAAGSSLSPEQQEYLINLAQLHEQAMAMRSVLGAGQSSEDLRAAILRTIPGPGTPNKTYAMKQLDAFEKTLNRLSRGVPKVPLRTDTGAQTFDVADPTGTVHHFTSQKDADAFKQAAGIK